MKAVFQLWGHFPLYCVSLSQGQASISVSKLCPAFLKPDQQV